MGRGIGQSFATGGYTVTLVDLDQKILEAALKDIRTSLGQLSAAGIVTNENAILDRISLESSLDKGVHGSSLVVEAIFENLAAKKDVFREVEASADAACIISTNTSSIPIASIVAAAKHPERMLGTHFWNPPQLMPAVEVVMGEETSEDTVTRALGFLKNAGKKPVVVRKDVPGQIGIRILYAMIREATWLVENHVASAADVDTAVKEALGSRLEILGPLELADLSGIDLVNSVASTLYKSLDSSPGPQKLIHDMVAKKELGVKTGRGFYDWRNDRDPAEALQLRDQHLMNVLKEKGQNAPKESHPNF